MVLNLFQSVCHCSKELRFFFFFFRIAYSIFFWIFSVVVRLCYRKSISSLKVSPNSMWIGVKFGTMPVCGGLTEELISGSNHSRNASLWSFSLISGMDPKCHVPISPIWHICKKFNTLFALHLKWECGGMWEICYLFSLEGKLIHHPLDKWYTCFRPVDKMIG